MRARESRKLKVKFWEYFPLPTSCMEVEAVARKWMISRLRDVDKGSLHRTEKMDHWSLFLKR